jgi:hypothetical protein
MSEELLNMYYKRRKNIENSFAWKYNGSVKKRVENLTKKYSKKIEILNKIQL